MSPPTYAGSNNARPTSRRCRSRDRRRCRRPDPGCKCEVAPDAPQLRAIVAPTLITAMAICALKKIPTPDPRIQSRDFGMLHWGIADEKHPARRAGMSDLQ